ncbi:MAG: hypothetical protein AMK71_08055 [Nitrospira bacterium SG8_35_4]|nr:MAG: hypothetical protein AMK71_08055 [Nitrospira bacterium SG8_35_4]
MSKRPVRVLHIVLSLGEGGGAEKLVHDIVKGCSDEGIESLVCCLDMLGPLGEQLKEQGHKVYFVKRDRGTDIRLIKKLRRILVDENITVIHAHQYTPFFYGVLASILLRDIRVIMTEHGRLYPELHNWKRRLINPVLASMAYCFVAVSESTRKSMITYDNFPAHKIKVIFNGVMLKHNVMRIDAQAKRESLHLDYSSKIVGTAARLNDVKNIPMMLRSFKLVLKSVPDTYLLIAGRGEKEAELKVLPVGLGISDRVKFLGLRNDLPEIYQLYDVFVLSSFTEGISVTLLETMNTGIPSIATAVGGNCEVVENNVTGHLVPLDDDKMMAEKIVGLLQDPHKRSMMGKNGTDRVRQLFSFEGMLKKYIQLYSSSYEKA